MRGRRASSAPISIPRRRASEERTCRVEDLALDLAGLQDVLGQGSRTASSRSRKPRPSIRPISRPAGDAPPRAGPQAHPDPSGTGANRSARGCTLLFSAFFAEIIAAFSARASTFGPTWPSRSRIDGGSWRPRGKRGGQPGQAGGGRPGLGEFPPHGLPRRHLAAAVAARRLDGLLDYHVVGSAMRSIPAWSSSASGPSARSWSSTAARTRCGRRTSSRWAGAWTPGRWGPTACSPGRRRQRPTRGGRPTSWRSSTRWPRADPGRRVPSPAWSPRSGSRPIAAASRTSST